MGTESGMVGMVAGMTSSTSAAADLTAAEIAKEIKKCIDGSTYEIRPKDGQYLVHMTNLNRLLSKLEAQQTDDTLSEDETKRTPPA